jgi:DNA-binding MarR family transcriptional regulator
MSAGPGGARSRRTANLVGALALALIDRMDVATAAATGLPRSQSTALVALANFAEGQPLGLLQRGLGLSQPAVARIIDRLEAGGLAVRDRGQAADGREVHARLTARGRRLVDRVLEARLDVIEEALADLPAGERRELTAAAERTLAELTIDADASRSLCRLCDSAACGHPDRCPVTIAARSGAASLEQPA